MKIFASTFLMAPMAGVTDLSFRERLRRNGCKALWTEMVSAAALTRNHRATLAMITPPDQGEDLALQLFGAKPDEMAQASAMVRDHGWARLDLNMGCPVKKVVKTGAGAALLRDLPLLGRVAGAARANFDGVLTAKIRTGWSGVEKNYLEAGKILEGEGVDGVILHGRTRADGYSGVADWEAVAGLAQTLNIPVAGNGDVRSGAEAFGHLGGDIAAVMIGRGAMSAPWLFREAEALFAGLEPPPPPTPAELAEDLRLHLNHLLDHAPERVAVAEMKKFVAWADKGHPGSAERRNRIMRADSLNSLETELGEIAKISG